MSDKVIKNPSNKNALPSVIISNFDEKQIYEIKVKYLKLARLDKISIEDMSIKDKIIYFNKIKFNGVDYPLQDNTKIEFDNYIIKGKYQASRKRIKLKRDGKVKIFFEYKGHTFQTKEGDEIIDTRETNATYTITIEDKQKRNDEQDIRSSSTQREIIKDNVIDTYKQISGFDTVTSKDIYTIKRYIEFKNEMMFYFQFIEEFFAPLDRSKNFDFYNFDFNGVEKCDKLYELIIYRTNDDFKNPGRPLQSYLSKKETVITDFEKVQVLLSTIRHALAHFNFDFIYRLFNNDLSKNTFEILNRYTKKLETFSISDISIYNIILNQNEEKHFEEKLNYLDNDQTIEILDEPQVKISKLYRFYTKISQKKPAFNKLINSFLSINGEVRMEIKNHIKQEGLNYFEDIHQDRDYKNKYIRHKNLVSEKQTEEFKEKYNGKKIKQLNDEIQKLKSEMEKITKENSIKRLKVKLRLAFGFISSEYQNFNEFNLNFVKDVREDKYKEIKEEQIKQYFDSSVKCKKFFVKETINNPETNKEEKVYIYNDIEKEKLFKLVKDNQLLQTITLLHLFVPKELKGDFVGFILRIYHEIKNISSDTKAEEDDIKSITNSESLKLKILSKNIKELSVFNYSISNVTDYNNEKDKKFFYEKGNQHLNYFYKKCNIAHTKELFDPHLVLLILKYYLNLYKLIGDFEIYSLLKYAQNNNINSSLYNLSNSGVFKENGYYNFKILLKEVHNIAEENDNKSAEANIKNIRNQISHQNIEKLFINFEKKWVLNQRKNIVEFLEKYSMQDILFYNPLNDFTMKNIQFIKSLRNYEEKRKDKISEIFDKKKKTPEDYFLLYKLQSIETIKYTLKETIGVTEYEKIIQEKIANVEKGDTK